MNRQLKRPLKPRSRDIPRIMFNRPSTHIRQPNRRRNRLLISIAGYFFSCLASRLPRTCRNWQRLHGCTHVCTYYTQASHAPYRIARIARLSRKREADPYDNANKRIIGKNVNFRYRSLTFVGHVLPPAFGSPKFPTAVESRAIPNIRTWPLPRLLSSWISQLYQSRWEPVGTFVHVGYIDTYTDEEMSICSTTFSHWRHVRSVP